MRSEDQVLKLIVFSNTDWYLYNYRVPIDSRLKRDGFEPVMVSPDGDFSKKIEEQGFKWCNLKMTRSGINIFQEIKTVRQMVKILKKEKPDIIHNFTMKGNINGTIAAKLAKVPRIVNSITGLGYVYASDQLKARLLRPFANIGYRLTLKAGKTIFQNPEDLSSFVKHKLVKEKDSTLIRSSGVDVDIFQPQEFPKEGFRILFAARMLWTKGVGELVEAARIVKKKYNDIEILLAGVPDEGNPATVLPEQIDEWVEEKVVTFLGFQQGMDKWINSCHIACFPSKHTEGTPKFLVEASACGRPIITTDNRGCREVYNGKNGILVPKGDSQALADAILRLYEDRGQLAEMGRESRKMAEEDFSVDRVASETARVYRSFN